MKRILFIVTVLSSGLLAQDSQTPLTIGGFETQGSATFGYRFTDVSGYEPKFQELFNLQSGPRMLDFSLFGRLKQGETNRFADDFSLTASGLGGDPFATTQFTLRKSHVYDLRATFRQSQYFWNRNDSAVQVAGIVGLTNNHDWATVRKLGSVNLLIHATNSLKFSFEYYRNSRDGVTYTTRSPDYYGSPSSWGSIARANPYYLIAPISELSNRVTGGADYSRNGWSLHYKLGYQVFDDAVNGNNLITQQRSLNLSDPTAKQEYINGMSWIDNRRLTTPVSEFAYTGKLASRVDLRGDYIFYRYQGPASLQFGFDGVFRNGSSFSPYLVSMTGRADVTEPNHVVDQGATYHVNEWWRVMTDYRFSYFTVDSNGQFRSVNGTTVASGTTDNQWRITSNSLDFNTVFTPATSLLIRAGVRLYNNDVLMIADGIVDGNRTKHIRSIWPIASFHYQPSKMFSVKADVDQVTNDVSYTRVTPHTDVGGRFVVRYRPIEKLYFEESSILRNRRLLQTDYRSTIRSHALTANYDLNDKFAVFAGFSYDDYYAANYVTFLRGTAPLTNTLRDQTTNRIWSGGFRSTPYKGFGVNFTGNYVRTTGLGEIGGEPPLYGPMTFPYATGSLYYDFPKAGRLTVQLQRTYYIEQIVQGNNFSANMLTLAWTKGF